MPEIGVTIQQEDKKTCFNAHAGGTWGLAIKGIVNT